MTTRNRIDTAFGPAGTIAGGLIFIAGLFMLSQSPAGLILLVIGAFAGFTYSGTVIDFNKRRLKFTNYIFGIWPAGKWISVEPEMKLGIKKTNQLWRAYSRSNRPHDVIKKDFRIILFDKNRREIMPIKKYTDPEAAKSGLLQLGRQLGLMVIQ